MTSYSLKRSVLVRATRSTVFRHFADSSRFASWWGQGSEIDAKPGGTVRIVYPNGVVALGAVVEISQPDRIVFTYGYEDPSKPIRPGGSRVSVTLEADEDGTWVHLGHDGLENASTRDLHSPGWRFQLSLLANVAANEQHAAVADRIDAFFSAWSGAGELDVTDDVTFRDAYACLAGKEELVEHLAAARLHLPFTLARSGQPRQCQGAVLCDWVASARDGTVRARGTNLFDLAPDGRIRGVTGFWEQPA